MKEDADGPSMKEDTLEGLRTYGKGGGEGVGPTGAPARRLVLVRLDNVACEGDVRGAMRVVQGCLEERGTEGLDVLVNNAGVMHRSDGGIEGL